MFQPMLADTLWVKIWIMTSMKTLPDEKAYFEDLFAYLEVTSTARSVDLPVEADQILSEFQKLIMFQTMPLSKAQS
jgi:hypothetical protein